MSKEEKIAFLNHKISPIIEVNESSQQIRRQTGSGSEEFKNASIKVDRN